MNEKEIERIQKKFEEAINAPDLLSQLCRYLELQQIVSKLKREENK
jgi:hypothetical protein